VFQAAYRFGVMDNTTGMRAEPGLPEDLNLEQNYPNPFNPTTTVKFSVPLGFVSLKVYDLLGREVATLVNDRLSSGTYTVQFDARHLASGVYTCRLRTGEAVRTRAMVLLR
jgi:hypothetical protein